MSGRVTREERALIDAALADGRCRRIDPPAGNLDRPVSLRLVAPDDRPVASRVPPAPYAPPAALSVQRALEWAFATECAQMDADEIAATSGAERRARGTEALIAERAVLGKWRIDVSPGRSEPAEEAQIIASMLRHALPWRDAVWLADLARARRVPDLPASDGPRLVPEAWVFGRGCRRGRTADLFTPGVAASLGLPPRGGWPMGANRERNRKGVTIERPVLFTPCTFAPSASQIAQARRAWLDWWGHLLTVRAALGARVGRIAITDDMPPMQPWRRDA